MAQRESEIFEMATAVTTLKSVSVLAVKGEVKGNLIHKTERFSLCFSDFNCVTLSVSVLSKTPFKLVKPLFYEWNKTDLTALFTC